MLADGTGVGLKLEGKKKSDHFFFPKMLSIIISSSHQADLCSLGLLSYKFDSNSYSGDVKLG